MRLLRIAPVFISVLLLAACFDDKSEQDTKQPDISVPTSSDNNAQVGMGAAANGSIYSQNKTIFCKMTSLDGQRVTTSSFFKYNPNTVDKITIDMLGDYPNQNFVDRMNSKNERYKLTDAMIEIPLRAGNRVFTVDIGNIWFSGATSIQFFKANTTGGLTHWDQGTIFFGNRTGDVTFEGSLQITYGDAIRVSSAGWFYAPHGNDKQLEYGDMECQDEHY